jgi:hypothetical protein
MRRISVLLLSAILVVAGSIPMQVVEAENDRKSLTTTETATTKRSRDLKVEARRGDAVKFRANQLKRKNKALAKALSDMQSRGLQPDFESGVSILGVDKSRPIKKIAAQDETTIIDGDYELTFFPYNNGNNATWEGVIYYRNAVGEAVFSALLDISAYSSVTVISEHCYMSTTGTQLRPVGKDNGRGEPRMTYSNHAKNAAPQVPAIRAFIECSVRGCLQVVISCRGIGPYWVACFVPACYAVALNCAIEHL